MNVLIIGNDQEVGRFKDKFPKVESSKLESGDSFSNTDLIVCFSKPPDYIFEEEVPLMIDVCQQPLAEYVSGKNISNKLVAGFCKLPSFFERDVFEISLLNENMDPDPVFKSLLTEYEVVADQVGLVTPRVIAMIINEAFYTLEDGTSKVEDIDTAMKLGTNYPYGPFEWAQIIGIENVYSLLNSVFQSTGNQRYRPCDLLKKEALLS